jgi:hypothetical protein
MWPRLRLCYWCGVRMPDGHDGMFCTTEHAVAYGQMVVIEEMRKRGCL